jgi:NAD+ diphosphatase
MMGCVARATSTTINLNDDELQDALWISKADLADALAGRSDEIAPARKGAVAQVMLQGWVDGLIPGFSGCPRRSSY